MIPPDSPHNPVLLTPYLAVRPTWLPGYRGSLWTGDGTEYAFLAREVQGEALGVRVITRNPPHDVLTFPLGSLFFDVYAASARDHLVRCGAPLTLRDEPGGLIAWALNATMPAVLQPWTRRWQDYTRFAHDDSRYMLEVGQLLVVAHHTYVRGWRLGYAVGSGPWRMDSAPLVTGEEIGEAGVLAADRGALNKGFVLTQALGWYVPLPEGKVGWLPREGA